MERQLPTIEIEGTTFLVDVAKKELRELGKDVNTISIFEMDDKVTHYEFEYDKVSKNIPFPGYPDLIDIRIPQFVSLDPEGMAMVYNKTVAELENKTDFDIMVNQEVLEARLSGRLTTIEIEGHTFYVDLPMDCIRPKDDFSTLGITFSELEEHRSPFEECYVFPYNPATFQIEQLDYDKITSIPKDIVLIEIPLEHKLDPVGFARKYEREQREFVRQNNIQSHFIAKRVDWADTYIPKLIEENKERLSKKPEVKEETPKKRKGKKM
ncbi:MAG: hypothetical protein P0Y49_13950 [Candidatus Pedobacter colombiensis]|uniref:Uncharacterized protein n=1 Tax=Candidatus Pedobacter colombiensis TaxID=3121371 RepID=A0AAJ5W4N3_9SPHI|nr:hypothetical protein [Pedobacter sp.]WEK17902.1 MAG: hypothetical protein P0Y49_13950 [Pedobacter sp.]